MSMTQSNRENNSQANFSEITESPSHTPEKHYFNKTADQLFGILPRIIPSNLFCIHIFLGFLLLQSSVNYENDNNDDDVDI